MHIAAINPPPAQFHGSRRKDRAPSAASIEIAQAPPVNGPLPEGLPIRGDLRIAAETPGAKE